jgi:hypothetical protein
MGHAGQLPWSRDSKWFEYSMTFILGVLQR